MSVDPEREPLDIDLEELNGPGPDWRRLEGREAEVWINEKTGHLKVIPTDKSVPPSQWDLLR